MGIFSVRRRMEKQYKDMIYTRRLYAFEGEFFRQAKYNAISKQRTINTLKTLGQKIWDIEAKHSGKPIPVIRFGKGVYHTQARLQNAYYSWCDGVTIELAPTQRDIVTLIHELVHGLGYQYHDSRFVGKYIKLLVKYAKLNKQDIIQGMKQFEVTLPAKYR